MDRSSHSQDSRKEDRSSFVVFKLTTSQWQSQMHDTLFDQLCTGLKHKESDTLEDFLGVHIERADGRLHLNQPGLIRKLITTAGLNDDDKPVYNTHKQGEVIRRLYGCADAAYACHRNGHSHSVVCFA